MRNPLFYPSSFHLSECISLRLSLFYQVVCGPNNKGYTIHLPTTLLKTIAPALKWGLLLLKVALATQGTIKNSLLLSSPLLSSTEIHLFSSINSVRFYIVNRLHTKHLEVSYLLNFNAGMIYSTKLWHIIQYDIIQYDIIPYHTILYYTILYYTAPYYTQLHNTIQYILMCAIYDI